MKIIVLMLLAAMFIIFGLYTMLGYGDDGMVTEETRSLQPTELLKPPCSSHLRIEDCNLEYSPSITE